MRADEGDETGPAAIVSYDVALGRLSICYARRDDPVDESDSGWQFTSGRPDATEGPAQVWSVTEVVAREPSLAPFVHLPAGTTLERGRAGERWQVTAAARS